MSLECLLERSSFFSNNFTRSMLEDRSARKNVSERLVDRILNFRSRDWGWRSGRCKNKQTFEEASERVYRLRVATAETIVPQTREQIVVCVIIVIWTIEIAQRELDSLTRVRGGRMRLPRRIPIGSSSNYIDFRLASDWLANSTTIIPPYHRS